MSSSGRSWSGRRPSVRSCRRLLELGELDVLDLGDRQLQEARAHRAKRLRIARGEEAVRALAVASFSSPSARGSPRPRAQSPPPRTRAHVASEDALEDRPDQRVVRAAEDHRVDARLLQRRRVFAHGVRSSPSRTGRRSRSAARAAGTRRHELNSRVECAHELRVAAGGDRACVASRPTRRFRVAWTAACASGVITPTTGTSSSSCSCGSAAEVAVLHALTTSFTPWLWR